MDKQCKNCDLVKHETEFHFSRKTGRLEEICKDCKAIYNRSQAAKALARTKKRKDTSLDARSHIAEQMDTE